MARDRAAIAAFNNAVWCDAVCRAYGGTTSFDTGLWCHADPSPPYFPGAVTLAADLDEGRLMHALQGRPEVIGVKDSFCRLDLREHGFSKLFEARWLWREPRVVQPRQAHLRWAVVDTPALLEQWAAAWWPEPGALPAGPAVFGTALLAEPAVQLLAGFGGDRLVAGCAVTCSDGVAGLSCSFFPAGEAGRLRGEMLAIVQAQHAGKALVSYDQGANLEALLGEGFEGVGPLQVWLGRPPA